MAETGLSFDELRARGIEAAGDIQHQFAGLEFTIPVAFDVGDTGGLWDSAGKKFERPVPMAAGGFGRVTRPTLFLAGESGSEDVAFSGGGRRFGGGGGGTAIIQLDRRTLAEVIVPAIPGVIQRYGLA
jgi:hypothetical protein